MAKKKGPAPDGSVLLVLFNPYGLPAHDKLGSIMDPLADKHEVIHKLKQTLRWLNYLGLRVSQVFGKRTELAVIVDVQTSDKTSVDSAIGMHRWNEFLPKCAPAWDREVAHIYPCVSTSIEHLERTLNFNEFLGLDPLRPSVYSSARDRETFIYPPPISSLPEPDKWPRGQSGLPLYVRPKILPGIRPARKEEVDDFLGSIGLPSIEISVASGTPGAGPSESRSGLSATATATTVQVQIDRSREFSREQSLSETLTSRASSMSAPRAQLQSQAGPSHPRDAIAEDDMSQRHRQSTTLSTTSTSTVAGATVRVKSEPVEEDEGYIPLSVKGSPERRMTSPEDVRVTSEARDSTRSLSTRRSIVKEEVDELQDDDTEMGEASNAVDGDAEDDSDYVGPHPWDSLDEQTRESVMHLLDMGGTLPENVLLIAREITRILLPAPSPALQTKPEPEAEAGTETEEPEQQDDIDRSASASVSTSTSRSHTAFTPARTPGPHAPPVFKKKRQHRHEHRGSEGKRVKLEDRRH